MNRIKENKDLEDYFKYKFIESPLVEIKEDMGIIIDLQYPKKGFINAIDKAYLRKEVVDKLLLAKSYLPEGLTFKIWDSYRPFALQEELYNKYKKDIIKSLSLERIENPDKIISNYVSIPTNNKLHPPLHTTGGAVDLTLVRVDTLEELDMGTEFDSFTELARTATYENKNMNIEIRNNRRILYSAMTKAGFINLPSEWWHYDYGDRAWAYYNNKEALYDGIFDLK